MINVDINEVTQIIPNISTIFSSIFFPGVCVCGLLCKMFALIAVQEPGGRHLS